MVAKMVQTYENGMNDLTHLQIIYSLISKRLSEILNIWNNNIDDTLKKRIQKKTKDFNITKEDKKNQAYIYITKEHIVNALILLNLKLDYTKGNVKDISDFYLFLIKNISIIINNKQKQSLQKIILMIRKIIENDKE